jgi:hypothetical protein
MHADVAGERRERFRLSTLAVAITGELENLAEGDVLIARAVLADPQQPDAVANDGRGSAGAAPRRC